jgi:hypothetical protein
MIFIAASAGFALFIAFLCIIIVGIHIIKIFFLKFAKGRID